MNFFPSLSQNSYYIFLRLPQYCIRWQYCDYNIHEKKNKLNRTKNEEQNRTINRIKGKWRKITKLRIKHFPLVFVLIPLPRQNTKYKIQFAIFSIDCNFLRSSDIWLIIARIKE